ncbi:MAG: DnaJ domain-containing protein [Thermostichus sp. DG02_5_bins_236]
MARSAYRWAIAGDSLPEHCPRSFSSHLHPLPFMDYYAILNVSPEAGTEEVKQAFRQLARQFHPDVAGEGSRERFQQIRKAYQVLSDPEQRRQYDAQRQSLPPGTASSSSREGRVVVRTGSPSENEPDLALLKEGIARVRAAWRNQQLPTAVAQAEALRKRFPNSGEVVHILALAYQRFGNYLIYTGRNQQAEAYLRKALATEPRNRELVFEIKRDLARLGIQD